MRGKGQVRELLTKGDLGAVVSLVGRSPGGMRELRMLLLEPEDLIRWRAIQAIGKVMAVKAGRDLEAVREEVRRLLWSMSDESGNFLPHAPEAIGEILANVPPLIDEFAAVLFSFIEEEPFERGVHWAIARISQIAPRSSPNLYERLTG
jgi:hypothetical protein